jgi:hypothetical protein
MDRFNYSFLSIIQSESCGLHLICTGIADFIPIQNILQGNLAIIQEVAYEIVIWCEFCHTRSTRNLFPQRLVRRRLEKTRLKNANERDLT